MNLLLLSFSEIIKNNKAWFITLIVVIDVLINLTIIFALLKSKNVKIKKTIDFTLEKDKEEKKEKQQSQENESKTEENNQQ